LGKRSFKARPEIIRRILSSIIAPSLYARYFLIRSADFSASFLGVGPPSSPWSMQPQESAELSTDLPSVWFNRLAEGEQQKQVVTPPIAPLPVPSSAHTITVSRIEAPTPAPAVEASHDIAHLDKYLASLQTRKRSAADQSLKGGEYTTNAEPVGSSPVAKTLTMTVAEAEAATATAKSSSSGEDASTARRRSLADDVISGTTYKLNVPPISAAAVNKASGFQDSDIAIVTTDGPKALKPSDVGSGTDSRVGKEKAGLGMDGIYYSSQGKKMQENTNKDSEKLSKTRMSISSDMLMPSSKAKLDMSRVPVSQVRRSLLDGIAPDVVNKLTSNELEALDIDMRDATEDVEKMIEIESVSSFSSGSDRDENSGDEAKRGETEEEGEAVEGEGERDAMFGAAGAKSFNCANLTNVSITSNKIEVETVVVKRYRKHHFCNCGTCLPHWFACIPTHIPKNPWHPKRWKESKEMKEEAKTQAAKKKQLEKLKKQASKIIQQAQQDTPLTPLSKTGDGDDFVIESEKKRKFFQERMARGSIVGTPQHKHRHKRSTLNLEKASMLTLTGNFGEEDVESKVKCSLVRVKNILVENYFLVLMVFMILLAMPYPYLGTSDGPLQTKWSVSYGVNIIVFFISGLTLKTEELVNAFKSVKLNVCIQGLTFGVVPALFWLIYILLKALDFHKALSEGFCILGCLPMTVNMCYVLTSSADGDASAALFNATLGNILGTFISPLLIFGMLQVSGNVSYGSVLIKLMYKILIPLFVGQAVLQMQHKCACVKYFVLAIKPHGKRMQESLLGLIGECCWLCVQGHSLCLFSYVCAVDHAPPPAPHHHLSTLFSSCMQYGPASATLSITS